MPASLSLNTIRSRCVKFAHEWNDCVGDEKQEGHEFMRELMMCFGITERKAIAYEKRSNRASTGRQGYIDALIPGRALIEMKSAGKDLDKAEEQALDYIHDLAEIETPRLLIISDFRRIRIVGLDHDMTSADGMESGRTEFELAKLPDHVDDLKSLAGYGMVQVGSREQEKHRFEPPASWPPSTRPWTDRATVTTRHPSSSSASSFVSTVTTQACGNVTCLRSSWIPGPVKTAATLAHSSHSSTGR